MYLGKVPIAKGPTFIIRLENIHEIKKIVCVSNDGLEGEKITYIPHNGLER